MIYARTSKYKSEYTNLSSEDRAQVKKASKEFKEAIENNNDTLRKKLNIHKLGGYNNPDVWAAHISGDFVFTFNYEKQGNDTVIKFRRIGTHKIYRNP